MVTWYGQPMRGLSSVCYRKWRRMQESTEGRSRCRRQRYGRNHRSASPLYSPHYQGRSLYKMGGWFGKGFSIDFGVFYTFLARMDSFGVWIRKPPLNTPMCNCPSSFPSPLIPRFSSYSLNLLRLLFLLFLHLFLYFHLFLLIITRQWHSQEFMMGSYWYVFYVIKIHFHVKYSK